MDAYLHERKVERERTISEPVRDQIITHSEPERVRTQEHDREGHGLDFSR